MWADISLFICSLLVSKLPMNVKLTLKRSRRGRSTDMLCSTSRMRSQLLLRLWEVVMRTMMIIWEIFSLVESPSAGNPWFIDDCKLIMICRYGLYDFEYEHQCQGTTDSSKKQKLFLMSWCPDRWVSQIFSKSSNILSEDDLLFSAKIKKKMLYSSSFDALKKSLIGVQKYIQVLIIKLHSTYSNPKLFLRQQMPVKHRRSLLRSSWDPLTEFRRLVYTGN